MESWSADSLTARFPRAAHNLAQAVIYQAVADALEDAFDLVLRSIPSYGFSGKQQVTGWNPDRVARAWTELMRRLGRPLLTPREALISNAQRRAVEQRPPKPKRRMSRGANSRWLGKEGELRA